MSIKSHTVKLTLSLKLLFSQIACGLNFKYNYFIKGKGKSGSSGAILWKPGPEFFLLVPPTVHGDAQILVRDSWIRSDSQIPAAHESTHYIEEMYPLEHTRTSLPVKGVFPYSYQFIVNFFA